MAMGSERKGLLGWRGISADPSRASRVSGIVVLCVACVAMVATQLNYVVVGDAHMIVVLAPITACSLLYGTLPGTVCGALAGLAELIHAQLLPLDYYEKYFAAPWNSVLLFALVGLLMGVLFALTERPSSEQGAGHSPLALLGVCALGSLVFTAFFHQSTYLINSALDRTLPTELLENFTNTHDVFSQFLANLGLMWMLSVLATRVNALRREHQDEATIRETFQGWLAVVVVMAYMVTVAIVYTGVSIICRGDADRSMLAQIGQLETRLGEYDEANLPVHLTEDDLAFASGGISAVAQDGTIAFASVPAHVGESFETVVGAGLANGFDEDIYGANRSSEWDMGGGELGYLRAAQIGYVRVARSGNYQIMVAMSAADVFFYRTLLVTTVSAVFLVVFVAVFVQASMLLQNIVVRGFEETNATLAQITRGDLDQKVSVSEPVEFAHLSGGINATVDALKESIEEAETRIDRELRTAAAIQLNALPSTFPPFPEVDKFDIFASTSPAREVGGDFYDFFLIDDHTLGFLIADVSGKGIPAALFMMAAKTELGNYMASGMDLAAAMESVNYHLCLGNEAGMFVTAWAAKLDYLTGELTYANAGHNPPLLRHDGQWSWLRKRSGLFVGTFETAKYRTYTLQLAPGDELVLYTDGVTEAFSASEEEYGEERLERYLTAHADLHPHALVDGLRADVATWSTGTEQSDDITALALEFGVCPEASGSITVKAELENLTAVNDLIHAELAKRLCPISAQNQLDIALEELFVNVCRYAYADQEEPGEVSVSYVYNANPNAITVQITDHGVPFDPLTRKDPTRPASVQEATIGGLGILMAKKSVDDFTYLRDGAANVVAFRKMW